MKHNPKIKYVLVVLVIMIWGLVVYKVCAGLFTTDMPIQVSTIKTVISTDTIVPYSLMKDSYPDPFSNNITGEKKLSEEEVTVKAVPATPALQNLPTVEPSLPLPVIKYSGYIYNPVTKKKTAMISVNGRGTTVGINEKIDMEIKVLNITELKIVLSHNGKTIVVALGS